MNIEAVAWSHNCTSGIFNTSADTLGRYLNLTKINKNCNNWITSSTIPFVKAKYQSQSECRRSDCEEVPERCQDEKIIFFTIGLVHIPLKRFRLIRIWNLSTEYDIYARRVSATGEKFVIFVGLLQSKSLAQTKEPEK